MQEGQRPDPWSLPPNSGDAQQGEPLAPPPESDFPGQPGPLTSAPEAEVPSEAGQAEPPAAPPEAELTTQTEEGAQPSPADVLRRLLAKDTSLWSDSSDVQDSIGNRLGWLALHDSMSPRVPELEEFAREVRGRSYQQAVLLGMGGSSLAPEVLYSTFGRAPGYPPLTVLDTTDPATILAAERSLDVTRTLFIVSSKSGTTLETIALFRHFSEKARAISGSLSNFIAITDPQTPLEETAERQGFWRCFLNPPDVGGRYSALSYFGLVPATIIGVNPGLLLQAARKLDQRAGVGLGTLLAELAGLGGDKITFLQGGLPGFGAWAEQLIAESTGKDGRGLVPVEGEPLGPPDVYQDDRVFVRLQLADRPDGLDDAAAALEAAGHPVVTIDVANAYDLGAEFLRWEIATATAGALIGVNPFDEPNVQEAKDATAAILDQRQVDPDAGGEIYSPDSGALIRRQIEAANPGDYLALLAYVQRTPEHDEVLTRLRVSLRYISKLATTAGYGPRYLHSTGQLHKGGPDNGIFVFLTADDTEDLPIPGAPYTFGMLKRAQALGDLRSLRSRGRRVLHVHLGADSTGGLARLLDSVQQAASATVSA
jgi:glucose-6-phosphate isomerase